MSLREIAFRGYDGKIYKNANYLRNLAFEAYKAVNKATALAPEDGELRLLRGIIEVEMPFFVNKLEQGIDDLNRVLKSDVPDSTKAEAFSWLGEAYQKKAMSYWIKIVSEDPDSRASEVVFDRMKPEVKRFDLSQYQPPLLAVDFILGFQDELAPQTAVWIEDIEGKFVKTIYVSGFSGHVKEKQRRLRKWANSSKFIDVDAVTGAGIKLGHHIYVWDLKDNIPYREKNLDQQHFTSPQAAAFFPLIHVLIIYAAHPAPGVTVIAFSEQLVAHAPHSIQPSRSTIRALRSSIINTPWGHTISQTPHPTHASESSSIVETSVKYLNCSIESYSPKIKSVPICVNPCAIKKIFAFLRELRGKKSIYKRLHISGKKSRTDPQDGSDQYRSRLHRNRLSHLLFYAGGRSKRR